LGPFGPVVFYFLLGCRRVICAPGRFRGRAPQTARCSARRRRVRGRARTRHRAMCGRASRGPVYSGLRSVGTLARRSGRWSWLVVWLAVVTVTRRRMPAPASGLSPGGLGRPNARGGQERIERARCAASESWPRSIWDALHEMFSAALRWTRRSVASSLLTDSWSLRGRSLPSSRCWSSCRTVCASSCSARRFVSVAGRVVCMAFRG